MLLISSKVSVRLSLDLSFLWVGSHVPFLFSAVTPGDLLREWGGQGRRKNKTEAGKVRNKDKLKAEGHLTDKGTEQPLLQPRPQKAEIPE